MANTIKGVYVVDQENLKVGTDSSTFVNIAEVEEITIEIETNVNNWKAFGQEGWDSNFPYGKSATISIKGKRCIGDAGNDLLASKWLANGEDAMIPVQIVKADGATITWERAAVAIKTNGFNGAATDMAAFEAELTPHGKPTITNAVASTSTTTTTVK